MLTFPGTEEEGAMLLTAIDKYCTCEYGEDGSLTSSCASHKMLVQDARALSGLVFMRRMAKCLLRGEGIPSLA
jgi:hypothetical protein